MRAGQLKHRVDLLENQAEGDTKYGGKSSNWVSIANFRADFKYLSGRQYIDAQQVNNEVSARVWCRYRSGVKEKHRIRYEGNDFDIVHVVPNKKKRQVEIMLKLVK